MTDERLRGRLTWRRLVGIAGVLAALVMGTVAVGIGDLEAGIVAAGFALATGFTRFRNGRLGGAGLALASAITLFFMSTAAVTNIQAGSERASTLISSVLTAVALLGLIAALGFLARGGSSATTGPRIAVISSILVLIGLLVAGATTTSAEAEAPSADILLLAKRVAFSDSEITAPAGEITVTLANDDLFWHTFTIDELDVDLRVPVGAELSVTFEAPPGTYEYICAIPGHAEVGMKGVLIVEQ